MPRSLDQLDRRLLDLVQDQIPAVACPFEVLGKKLGVSSTLVIARLHALKAGPKPVIRQISAIFDSSALGYCRTLVAARVAEDHLDQAAAQINDHPGVSHNYRRDHPFNLWYTLAVPPKSRLGLEKTVQELHERSGAISTRLFPTLKMYKLGVRLQLSDQAPEPQTPYAPAATDHPLTTSDQRNIRVLQQDLPLCERPFDAWAQQAGLSTQALLHSLGRYEELKLMRRFAAVLHHREAGFAANAMGAWVVPFEMQDAFGAIAASFQQVSHCYLRPTYADWPYNIFTMIHAQQAEQCQDVLQQIGRAAGIDQYAALYSTHEYKKVRVQYFTGDIRAWEQKILEAKKQSVMAHSA